MRRRSSLAVVAVLGIAMFGGIVAIQSRIAPMNASSRDAAIRYIPDRDVMQLASFGFQPVYADILWVRAIQYLATPFEDRDAKYGWMQSIFQGMTDLDPRFISAYRLGSTWLSLIDRNGDAAVALLEKGIEENPDSWELPHDLAMIHYVDRHDRAAALEQLKVAISRPDCPIHVRTFAQFLMVEQDEAWGAIAMWLRFLDQNRNEYVRDVAMENLREATGRNPADLRELLASGHVPLRDGFDLTEGIAYHPADGQISSPRLDEVQERKALYLLNTAVKVYRERTGRSAQQLKDLLEVLYRIPSHPRQDEGYAYVLDAESGEVRVQVPAPRPAPPRK
jgi:hypothetical protein